ncbi:hypothetical protein AVEN_244322-1, partial [Araneus ventricosus]
LHGKSNVFICLNVVWSSGADVLVPSAREAHIDDAFVEMDFALTLMAAH